MFSTYEEAVRWIHSRLRLGIKPGLRRMEVMMERLGNPERTLKTIHIGGTNGKGSTVTFLRCILEDAGYAVGTFTSPYFEHFNERISINGKPCEDKDIIELVNLIKPLAEELEETELGGPTEFEVITAMSFYYFAKMAPVDVVLYEVGLGGRFDSTNIIHPLLSIITSIGLDHTGILGETLEEIAFEKAGIIKDGILAISGVHQEEAAAVIRRAAAEREVPYYEAGAQFSVTSYAANVDGSKFDYRSLFSQLPNLYVSMMGKHQAENASLAVMASELLAREGHFLISEKSIRSGIMRASWPGRFEIIARTPFVVIDGAHNEEGIKALVHTLTSQYSERKKTIVFAALRDKKFETMISMLDSVCDELIFTTFDFPRAASAEELHSASKHEKGCAMADWRSAINAGLSHLEGENMLIVTGSLYFLSEIKPYIVANLAR
ncbi:bifunctional folylpolyglutamate synthase/dihydrofolate synthase [Bacillus massilinigeriensis]|uniref:bifunctional folylpolyglutamate synthase/dihydrofolate synthase n=1 Tax=Bacillus mediterraneensis TaxID=1805474 RepID=UPI0008F865F7|nr:folylpolyglutamate synthase/dihydrofolate synthase family protein [Bacillus mediterraneensis]